MSVSATTCIAISLGDPLGIGPEVVAKALHGIDEELGQVRVELHGCGEALGQACQRAGLSQLWRSEAPGASTAQPGLVLIDDPRYRGPLAGMGRAVTSDRADGEPPPPTHDARAGAASFAAVVGAIEACRRSVFPARAICTAPISKMAWHLAGHQYPGHTELLGERLGDGQAVMFFWGPRLKLVLATVHVPLAEVPRELTSDRIVHCAALGIEACRAIGIANPRLAVCGLNPHAGEDGLLGAEDRQVIGPAIETLRRSGLSVAGPLPGDSVFLDALKADRKYDLFVAMYHDQGLIPVKLLDRDQSVNATLGLGAGAQRVVRTSPAHGTAFDIAGRNLADPASMQQAIRAALILANGAAGDGERASLG